MASALKKKSVEMNSSTLEINFPGNTTSDISSYLVIEIIKQLLYQREQIPLPVDQLKLAVQSSNPAASVSFANARRTQPSCSLSETNLKQERSNRILRLLYESYSQLFNHISNIFNIPSIHICEAIVLIGPTIVSPRETYHIHLTTYTECPLHDLPFLATRKCMHLVFKEMITNSCLWNDNHISLTNTTVFLKLKPTPSMEEYLEPMLNFNPFRSNSKKVVIKLNSFCAQCKEQNEENGIDQPSKETEEINLSKENTDKLNEHLWVKINPTLKGIKNSTFRNGD